MRKVISVVSGGVFWGGGRNLFEDLFFTLLTLREAGGKGKALKLHAVSLKRETGGLNRPRQPPFPSGKCGVE